MEISVPSHYTGFICEEAPPVSEQSVLQTADNTGILVSAGGDGAEQLRWCSIEAWKLLRQSADFIPPDMTLVLPLFHHDAELRELRQLTEGTPIRIERYTPQFLNWLPSARLSISQAGYNTCMNLLRSRTRPILIPHPQPPDQRLRARRFAERGLATALDHAELTGPSLAEAIRHALSQPAPQHNLDLNGVHRSCEIIDELLRQ